MKNVPLCRPSIGDEEIEAVVSVLKSGWLAHGEYNRKFEDAFALRLGVAHAISMNSCASALEISLQANGIDGEVIIPAMTMGGHRQRRGHHRRRPRLLRGGPGHAQRHGGHHCCLHNAPHAGGHGGPLRGPALRHGRHYVELCDRHGLLLIEDSAETLGATWNGTARRRLRASAASPSFRPRTSPPARAACLLAETTASPVRSGP